jgi:predicted extracellular nuclease
MKFQYIFILVLSVLASTGDAQDAEVFKRYESMDMSRRYDNRFRIGFYNVENLFDIEDDSLTSDESFTPDGENRYTYARYKKKSDGLAKTMLAMGGWEAVEVIGLCEVENRGVLEGLTQRSPLKEVGYNIIHQDSPDSRGIDIACIYRPAKFNVINYKYYRVRFPASPERTTRDILYVKGKLNNGDTLHVFINHWPSRYGGQFASEESRIYVADMLRQKVDSLNRTFVNPYIILTGDFNDYPNDISLAEHLKALESPALARGNDLVNLSYPIMYKFGSHSFAGEWGVLDQMIVSNSFFAGKSTSIEPTTVGIFDAPWLLTENAAGNSVTFRTYQGPAYVGGFSDHLPIFLDLNLSVKQKTDAVEVNVGSDSEE